MENEKGIPHIVRDFHQGSALPGTSIIFIPGGAFSNVTFSSLCCVMEEDGFNSGTLGLY
ncbi:hypothetical protein O5189_09045 [Escherichia coli]|nr:hypothetical protein [Escherichia coli]